MFRLDFIRFLLAIQTLFWLQQQRTTASPPRIAVIGGGIGGATASFYLNELFGSQIDIYEANRVGGRLAVVELDGRKYEAGGSLIHNRYRYMNFFARKLGLKRAKSPSGRLGIYNGRKYVLKESNYKLWTHLELLVRYGLDLFRWDTFKDKILRDFERIYTHQDEGYAFKSVEKLLESMGEYFVNFTQETAESVLAYHQFNERFIKELGVASTLMKYGQSTQINGLVGSISLLEAQPDLWSVEGGNHRLVTGAIALAEANLLSSQAKKIILQPDGKYQIVTNVKHIDLNNTKYVHKKNYDIVVIASPQTADLSSIEFEAFPQNISDVSGRYHQTIVTLVQGKLNYSFFDLDGESDALKDIITINTSMLYNSISKVYPVDWSGAADKKVLPVYKILSQQVLDEQMLDEMFKTRHVTKVINWLAYPHYNPPECLGSFQLHKRLYYTSAVEWAWSSMETSAIAGRNVALLAYHQWNGNTRRIDQFKNSLFETHEL